MCIDCWEDHGRTTLDTPEVRRAVELIATIYRYHAVGSPFHVELDDWNIDTTRAFTEPYPPIDELEVDDVDDVELAEYKAAARELQSLMIGMSVEARASALALRDGFWTLPK